MVIVQNDWSTNGGNIKKITWLILWSLIRYPFCWAACTWYKYICIGIFPYQKGAPKIATLIKPRQELNQGSQSLWMKLAAFSSLTNNPTNPRRWVHRVFPSFPDKELQLTSRTSQRREVDNLEQIRMLKYGSTKLPLIAKISLADFEPN